jgi:hypothetical protein
MLNFDAEFRCRISMPNFDGGMMRIAMLTSGGDAPGMNVAIRAATVVALS